LSAIIDDSGNVKRPFAWRAVGDHLRVAMIDTAGVQLGFPADTES
jgi:hypothetical protein